MVQKELRKILTAFKAIASPELDEWVLGSAWQDDDLIDAVRSAPRINVEFIEQFYDCLPNFTPKAKAFAIPRFLAYVSMNPYGDASEYLIFELDRLSKCDRLREMFTPRQIEVIRNCLHTLSLEFADNSEDRFMISIIHNIISRLREVPKK